jgi:hypothetical protein
VSSVVDSDNVAVFLRVLPFSLPILIPPAALNSLIITSSTLSLNKQLRNTGLMVCENRALGILFGSTAEKATGGWGKLNNDELQHLYPLPNIIIDQVTQDEMGGIFSMYGEMKNSNRNLVWKPEIKNQVGNLGVDERI